MYHHPLSTPHLFTTIHQHPFLEWCWHHHAVDYTTGVAVPWDGQSTADWTPTVLQVVDKNDFRDMGVWTPLFRPLGHPAHH